MGSGKALSKIFKNSLPTLVITLAEYGRILPSIFLPLLGFDIRVIHQLVTVSDLVQGSLVSGDSHVEHSLIGGYPAQSVVDTQKYIL